MVVASSPTEEMIAEVIEAVRGGDLDQFEDPSTVADVGVDNVRCPPLKDLPELSLGVHLLSGDHRDADLPPIPFPSAIAPRLAFHAAADAAKRVRAAADSFDALEPFAPA